MAAVSADRIHVSATWLIGLALPILVFTWNAQAGDIETTQKVVQKNAEQISILIERDQRKSEDIREIKEDVEQNAEAARNIERTLDRIAAKLEVKEDDG